MLAVNTGQLGVKDDFAEVDVSFKFPKSALILAFSINQ